MDRHPRGDSGQSPGPEEDGCVQAVFGTGAENPVGAVSPGPGLAPGEIPWELCGMGKEDCVMNVQRILQAEMLNNAAVIVPDPQIMGEIAALHCSAPTTVR